MKPYFQRGIALGALLTLVVGGGCKVGSDYQRPNTSAQVSESYTQIESEGVQQQVGADVSSWWSQINDPVLAELTQEAFADNLTLREALFRIQSARAALGSTSSNLLPQFAQDGAYSHQTYAGHSQSVFSTATSMSWELDFFGRVQRSIEAANADMEVQRELYRDAYVILAADVAQTYVDARSYQAQIAVASKNTFIQLGTLSYFGIRHAKGADEPTNFYQSKGILFGTQATIAALQTQYQQALNRLSILVGRAPGYVDERLASPELDELLAFKNQELELWRPVFDASKDNLKAELNAFLDSVDYALTENEVMQVNNLAAAVLEGIPETPGEILVGIPADLLRRRPDIRAAEQRIIAQNARVGVAVADLYPMFTLNGSFGLEANSFSNMFDSDSIVAGVGPAFRWNILNFGKYRFNIEAQRFMQEELVASYRNAILKAAEEVDNALTLYVNEWARLNELRATVSSYDNSYTTFKDQEAGGKIDQQAVLTAQEKLLNYQLQETQCRANMAGSVVQLYRALGGDWDSVGGDAPTAPPRRSQVALERSSDASTVDALSAAAQNREEIVVENSDFDIVADDSPELAEPAVAPVDALYADEALIAE